LAQITLRIGPPLAGQTGLPNASGIVILEEQVEDGELLHAMVSRLADVHGADFRKTLFEEDGAIKRDIILLHNSRALVGEGRMTATLADGDLVIFTPPYAGG